MPQQRQYPDHAARQRAYRARQEQARLTAQQAKGVPPAAPIPTLPSRARWQALITQARLALELARDEMQTYYNARSDAWREGERAATFEEHLDHLETVIDHLENGPSF